MANALYETLSRPPYTSLISTQSSATGALAETYTFPTGIWQVLNIRLSLIVADPTVTILPSQTGAMFHASNAGKWVESATGNALQRFDATNYFAIFSGFHVNFVAGDILYYGNFDLSDSGTSYWTAYVLAQRLR